MLHIFVIWKKCWLIVLIVAISLRKCTSPLCQNEIMKKEDCSDTHVNGVACKNCSSPLQNAQCRKWDIPHDLGSSMKCLFTYNLILENMTSYTFLKYQDLTHLYFLRAGFSDSIPKNTFQPLKKLQYLNLAESNWWENTEITWPRFLRFLDITRFPVNTFVGLNLDFLEVLNISRTQIIDFPTLSEIAPLKLVVLDKMNMTNFKIENLARLCKLESISMLNTSLGNDNCKCLLLKSWTQKYNVKILNEMTCKADTKCSLVFNEASLKNRNECLKKNEQKTWYYLIVALIMLLISMLCGCGFMYTWLIKKEEEEGILGITDEELEHFSPHPHHTTAELSEASDEEEANVEGLETK